MVNGLKPVGLALGIGAAAAAGVCALRKVREMLAAHPAVCDHWGPYPFGVKSEEDGIEKAEKSDSEAEAASADAL